MGNDLNNPTGESNLERSVAGRNILLLQGPMGPFFRKLNRFLVKSGARVWQVCFNASDLFFAKHKRHISYRGSLETWRKDVLSIYFEQKIDAILLFGDCRGYHRIAIDAAEALGIDILVFEEGYIRPHYLTLEKGGVNAFTSLSEDAEFYLKTKSPRPEAESVHVPFAFSKAALYSTLYFILMELGHFSFPNYKHHRNASPYREAAYGLRNYFRKNFFRISERLKNRKITKALRDTYYFVPLQTESDAQFHIHSDFESIPEFIETLIASFARNAPTDQFLVFKHHPGDRGRTHYGMRVKTFASKYGVSGRVLYTHDIHLPTAIKQSLGVVTINSTVGISSLYHGAPTLVLGRANYDIEGLTCKGVTLDEFWMDQKRPDRRLFLRYRDYLLRTTQIPGVFYASFPEEEILLERICSLLSADAGYEKVGKGGEKTNKKSRK